MLPWTKIVIHHSLTEDGAKLSWNAIRKYHREVRGWSDIGYHFGVEWVGKHFNVLVGRPLTKRGAHAPGANRDGIGICLIGNFDKAPPANPLLRHAAKYIVAPLILAFDMDWPDCVVGHNEVTAGRTCPGKHFDMDALMAYTKLELV